MQAAWGRCQWTWGCPSGHGPCYPAPCISPEPGTVLTPRAQFQTNRWFSTQGHNRPETWFFFQSHSSPPPIPSRRNGAWAGKLLRAQKVCRGHTSKSTFSSVLKSPLAASRPPLGRTRRGHASGVPRALGGGMWAAPGRPHPRPPSSGPQELGGPRGKAWKNQTLPSACLRALAWEPTPIPRTHPIGLHSPRQRRERSLVLVRSSQPGREHPEGLASPRQPESDIPTPTPGCGRRALSAAAECHCSLFLLSG